ncbi:uncharacterized protein LOC141895559 isoform X2 [Acropora palmata]|uniref:uncharacterized protein LOC141895559 isoform X2 n=1 Tax=Acropora palmata TaxID=6131 RepID=UPI003DA153BC
MGDGVTRINVKQAQSVAMTTVSSTAGTSQGVPPYGQQFGAMQAASAAPMCPPPYSPPPYNQQIGAVQAAPVGYNQQFAPVQAPPVGGYFNPNPAPVVTNNTYTQQVVEVTVPKTNVVVVEPPERNFYFYCFDCSGDYQWYDLRGKGFCWIFLLLLLWLTVGCVIAAVIVLWFVVACLAATSDND